MQTLKKLAVSSLAVTALLTLGACAGMSERELLIRHDLLLGRVSADHYEKLKLLAQSLATE